MMLIRLPKSAVRTQVSKLAAPLVLLMIASGCSIPTDQPMVCPNMDNDAFSTFLSNCPTPRTNACREAAREDACRDIEAES